MDVTLPILVEHARTLFALAERMEWRGYDPYDLLLSPLLRGTPHVAPLLARALIQAGRRTGVTPRRWLGIRPHQEPDMVSDFLAATVLLAHDGYGWAGAFVEPLCHLLDASAVEGPHGRGWGLAFPYCNRFVHAHAHTPNLYQTVRAVSALLDAYGLTGDRHARDLALNGVRFVLDGLGHHDRDGRRWLRYWSNSDDCIVNVQALAAGALARAALIAAGDDRMTAASDAAATTVVASQRASGAWRYSEDGRAGFIDGIHTGFILDGLTTYRAARGEGAVEGTAVAVRDGFRYFTRRLMSADGMPLAVAGGRPTRDGQTLARCIETLVVCAEGSGDVRRATRVWRQAADTRARDMATNAAARPWSGWTPGYPMLRGTVAPFALATVRLAHAGAVDGSLAWIGPEGHRS